MKEHIISFDFWQHTGKALMVPSFAVMPAACFKISMVKMIVMFGETFNCYLLIGSVMEV